MRYPSVTRSKIRDEVDRVMRLSCETVRYFRTGGFLVGMLLQICEHVSPKTYAHGVPRACHPTPRPIDFGVGRGSIASGGWRCLEWSATSPGRFARTCGFFDAPLW